MLSEKIQEWSLWKILIVANVISFVLFIPTLMLFNNRGFGSAIYGLINSIWPSLNHHIYLSYQWIPAIILVGILFVSFKYSLRKLGKIEQNTKLNKIGKVLFGIGIIIGVLIWFFDKISEWIVYKIKFLYLLAYYTYGLSILLIPFLFILIGTILWIKSNYGGKNTFRIFLIAIGSLIIQTLAFIGFASLYDLLF